MLPVIRLAASEARNKTTEAISSTWPNRPMGILDNMKSRCCCVIWLNIPVFRHALATEPGYFWGWLIPVNALIKGVFLALFLTRGRRVTIALLAAQIIILMVPYWHSHDGAVQKFTMHLFGY